MRHLTTKMAAPRIKSCYVCLSIFFLILADFSLPICHSQLVSELSGLHLNSALQDNCVLVATKTNDSGNYKNSQTHSDSNTRSVLIRLQHIFESDPVVFGTVDLDKFVWPNGKPLKLEDRTNVFENAKDRILFFPKIKLDRSCLSTMALIKSRNTAPPGELYKGPINVDTLTEFVNSKCGLYRQTSGMLNNVGLHRNAIMDDLFRVESITTVSVGMLYSVPNNPLNRTSQFRRRSRIRTEEPHCERDGDCENHDDDDKRTEHNFYSDEHTVDKPEEIDIAQCDRINANEMTKERFFTDFLKRSKPVILEGGVSEWKVMQKWTTEYLRSEFGHRKVHVKMTPGGDFEGVEKAELWEGYDSFEIPQMVKEQLRYPDLVVVRPAGVDMIFSDFLDLIHFAATQPSRNVSAYLEYSSIPDHMPELQKDIKDFPFVKNILSMRHLNMWLSDGNTLGRLHFDPFDNLLCQIKGIKQVLLFEPFNNTYLYEAHIPQATLSYKKQDHMFYKRKLEDSTSMVMSPVNILQPDFDVSIDRKIIYPPWA